MEEKGEMWLGEKEEMEARGKDEQLEVEGKLARFLAAHVSLHNSTYLSEKDHDSFCSSPCHPSAEERQRAAA